MAAFFTVILALFLTISAHAQLVEVPEERPESTETPRAKEPRSEPNLDVKVPNDSGAGRARAGNYFLDRKKTARTSDDGPAPRYLVIHLGTFFTSDGYRYGNGDQSNIGKFNVGVDYRLGEWVNTADLALRVDYTTLELDEGQARKLSVSGIISFPDANSRFPLYFGAGLGPGFFLKQIHNESFLALDYSLFAGVRFLNVFEKVGFLVESGIKNHIHLFSDGQFNGIYINVGTVFLF